MPKSKSRRRRSAAGQTVTSAPTLEDDLSVVVEGDKVLSQNSQPDAIASQAKTPKLKLAFSTRTGKPVIKPASVPEELLAQDQRSLPAQRSAQQAPSTGPTRPVSAYGPDGALVDKIKPSDDNAADTEALPVEAAEDLRQIAHSVALSPIPEPTPSKRILDRLQSMLSRAVEICQDTWDAGKRYLAHHGIKHPRDIGRHLAASQQHLAQVAFSLRIGLGALFVVGGINKLSKLLSPSTSDLIVASYISTTGYINEFFMAFLFAPGAALTPWSFLTALSTFELVTGVMLLAGLLVRPVALLYAFMLWTFVIALPVVTTNGVDPGVKTYMAPAMLVQIRDIALSGFMFVLYGLGSGVRSIDYRLFGPDATKSVMSWQVVGLLLRLSIAIVLIVGGLFAGMPNIKTYLEPGLLLVIVALAILWGGPATRYAAGVCCAVIFVYMLGKIGLDKGVIGSLNAIKRELAIFAGAFVLAARDCGQLWTAPDVARRLVDGFNCAKKNLTNTTTNLKPAE